MAQFASPDLIEEYTGGLKLEFTRTQRLVIGAACGIAVVAVVALIAGHRGQQDEVVVGAASQPVSTVSGQESGKLAVHVAGAVHRPGVCMLATGARVRDAILAAGGLSPTADPQGMNLAAFVADGQMITVPSTGAAQTPQPPRGHRRMKAQAPSARPAFPSPSERPKRRPAHAADTPAANSSAAAHATDRRGDGDGSATSPRARFPIDVNTATAGELDAIPRIGPTLADRIISHRRQHGPFRSLDDLTQVKGIGRETLVAMAPYITM